MEAFMQFKNTDICLDFTCSCGEANHYDGYFAYEIACGNCKKIYKLSDKIEVTALSPEDSQLSGGAMEPIKLDEEQVVAEPGKVVSYPAFKNDIVIFDHDEITKGCIAGEGKPEIIEPSKAPGDWMKVRDELDSFLKNSPRCFS
ncbi:hypothetical protein JM79_3254 [Gramella sp. Hel_I_59]|uniref:hypothetical protein n=1 Tax=Gramella sp. Hel_I_59 TaxID=1249978 RepID=UPI001150C839|nr:hypothetical protein [Gramella sp. Hel_I_59]TQI72296.1 hypothetical protein JM79_3254 [Gramella sp. Hel_I_59]